MELSKAQIDKAGRALAADSYADEAELVQMEDVFDAYRGAHLQPLSETTSELQHMLSNYGASYYIAQRLKRKPQIARKLRRLTVRLSQLQDIGGCRIIVQTNADVDALKRFLEEQVSNQSVFAIKKFTDYREKGRDVTGYRALHVLLERKGSNLELQIRSRVQHYWAESIERTSVIYGHYLKEGDGSPQVLEYFRCLSDAFYEHEAGREPPLDLRIRIDELRSICEELIKKSDRHKVFDSFVNEDIIRTLTEKERKSGSGLNNWILVFDWNAGAFVSWDIVSRSPHAAVRSYIEYERNFPAAEGYEVVLVGSSEVATVRQTHSHYFGIDSYASILEGLDVAVVGFTRKIEIDVGARQILAVLRRRKFWGRSTVTVETLANHLCKNVLAFDSSLQGLLDRNYVMKSTLNGGLSLNVRKKAEIEASL